MHYLQSATTAAPSAIVVVSCVCASVTAAVAVGLNEGVSAMVFGIQWEGEIIHTR
jgi:ABC-type multidrug transport system permease subunit